MLEIGNVSKAVSRLDADERGITKSDTLSGQQEMLIVSESGLYFLITRSNKPEAKKFMKWITSEVLPSIRKTGSYSLPQVPPDASRYLSMSEEDKAIAYFQKEKEVKFLTATLEEAKEKVEFVDNYVLNDKNEGSYLISQVAKMLNVAQKTFFDMLKKKRILFKRNGCWLPYATISEREYFRVGVVASQNKSSSLQTRVTSKGLYWLAKQFNSLAEIKTSNF